MLTEQMQRNETSMATSKNDALEVADILLGMRKSFVTFESLRWWTSKRIKHVFEFNNGSKTVLNTSKQMKFESF
jgi:hypothetical protein